ncbi:hypothetical protein ACQBAU_16130 [Propionibacteriaceae bacterium Y2011]
MPAPKLAPGWIGPEQASKVLPLTADEIRTRCAQYQSSKGRDRTAIQCMNLAPRGSVRARWAIPESELTEWPRRQMSATTAGGVL